MSKGRTAKKNNYTTVMQIQGKHQIFREREGKVMANSLEKWSMIDKPHILILNNSPHLPTLNVKLLYEFSFMFASFSLKANTSSASTDM